MTIFQPPCFIFSNTTGHAVRSDGACARSAARLKSNSARANTRNSRLLFEADPTRRRPLLLQAQATHDASNRASASLCVPVAHAVKARARPASESANRALVAAQTAHASARACLTVHIATHSISTRIARARRRGLPAKISAESRRRNLADSASEHALRSW